MKVLLVEDMLDGAEPVIRFLEMRGYEVEHAFTYDEAKDKIENIDVVVTDWDLGPRSSANGDEVVKLAKSLDKPVMLWSGLDRPDTGADFQTSKMDIDGFIDWIKEQDGN
jgi:DNA-binding response OmpR family regulator